MDRYVLISYSSKDADKADRFCETLSADGVRTWMAPRDIPPGMQYGEAIMNAIRECACFVVLISDSAQRSVFVSKELERAVSYRKPVIPVLLENTPLRGAFELFLSENQSISAPDPGKSTPEMRQIIRRIKQYIGASEDAAAGEPSKKGSDTQTAPRSETANPVQEAKMSAPAQKPKRMRRIAVLILLLCLLAAIILGILFSKRGKEVRSGQDDPGTVQVSTQQPAAQWHVLTDSVTSSGGYIEGEGPGNLFDGDLNTKWCVPLNEKAYVEWQTSAPVLVRGIRFGIGCDSFVYPGRSPAESALYGYREEGDETGGIWELIWRQQEAFPVPEANSALWNNIVFNTLTDMGTVQGALRAYSRFRYEVTATGGESVMQLSGLALWDGDEVPE